MTNYGGESARIITAVKIYTSTCEVVGIDDPGEGGVLHLLHQYPGGKVDIHRCTVNEVFTIQLHRKSSLIASVVMGTYK